MNSTLKNIIGTLLAILLLVCIIVGVDFIFSNKNENKPQNDVSQQVIKQVNPQNTEAQKKSKDISMANEMTNAIERFTSEYELYLQDIASNSLDFSNLDASQSRVYNVTNVKNCNDVSALETTGLNGKQIVQKTKYPSNKETLKAIVQTYIKNDNHFTTAQANHSFWYSPDCGLIVCSKASSTVTDLNKLVISGMDARGQKVSSNTKWINISQ